MTKFAVQRHIVAGAPKRARWGKAKQCYWCGISVTYSSVPSPTQATREHLVPRFDGGGMGSNIAVACLRCNNARRRDITWIPWRDVPIERRRVNVPMRFNNGNVVPALEREWLKEVTKISTGESR